MQNNSKPNREKTGRKHLFYRYSILLLLFVAAVTTFLTRNTSDRSQIGQKVDAQRAPPTQKDATATSPLNNSKPAPSTAGLSAGPQQPTTATPPTRQKDPIQKEAFFDKRANREFQVVKGEVMVRFKKDVTQNDVAEVLKNLEATVIQEKKQLGVYRLRIPQNISVSDFITQHENNEKLQFVEPNFIAAALGSLTNAPNDPLYSSQWGLAKIQAEKAWETTTGSSNVIVAVLDSGVEMTHPDLKNKVVPGYDFVNGDNDPTDDHGHGTEDILNLVES
jgi:subtilisin family serine protease